MSEVLRVFLIIAAIVVLVFVVKKIKRSKIQVTDSVFWFLFAGSFVLLAFVPQVASVFSMALGFEAPSNFIFFYVIGVLMIREFSMTEKVSQLRSKLDTLVQEMALREDAQSRSDTE